MIRKRTMIGLAGVLALGSCAFGENAVIGALNLIETTEFTVEGDTLVMNGEINSKTLNQFEAAVADNNQITTLREVNVPGSLNDDVMIALSYRVRELGLNTELLAQSEIYSGGVDLFLAGVERRMEEGATIGVHSWSDGVNDAVDFPRSSPEHDLNRGYIEDMLGNDAFYWFTIEAAPAAEMHIMTPTEITQYGLLTEPALAAGSLR